jgi:diacylglycerol kinase (ATP)
MSKLAIIANPQAHRNRLWPLAGQALRKAAPQAAWFEPQSVEQLSAVCARVAEQGCEVVAIAGGDGTVQAAVTALDKAFAGALPLLCLLGGGQYDSLAALGGRGAAEARLKRLSVALASGSSLTPGPGARPWLTVVERDTLRVDGALGFRFGVGLPVRFVEAVYQEGGGPSAGLKTLVRAAGSSLFRGPLSRRLYQPLPVQVFADGEEWPPLPLYGLVCSTVAEAGLGLRPFRRALEQPGFFQVLGLTAGPRAFALELPRLLCGQPARRDRLLDGIAERLELRPIPHAQGGGEQRYLLDGELRTVQGPLSLSMGPRVRVVRP